jgi:hypothetical protein
MELPVKAPVWMKAPRMIEPRAAPTVLSCFRQLQSFTGRSSRFSH